jgi:hypothetical protein
MLLICDMDEISREISIASLLKTLQSMSNYSQFRNAWWTGRPTSMETLIRCLTNYQFINTVEGRTTLAKQYVKNTWKQSVPSLLDISALNIVSRGINFKQENLPLTVIEHMEDMIRYIPEYEQSSLRKYV